MARYTLTLSPDYVKNWSISDAIREFIQNAIDQETQDKINKKEVTVEGNTLRIANATSILTKKSLLLGGGTKKEGDNNIGQFGEGYKIGLLVLLREGFSIKINNYGVSELWTPKIVNSRIYESEVLAIDTKEFDFGEYQLNSLDIEISKEGFDFNEILSNLWLEWGNDYESLDKISTNNSDILLEEKYKGNIYVKGLYIGKLTELKYGYNFEPNIVKVGRDRNLVNAFDVKWDLGKRVWNRVDFTNERNLDLLKKDISSEIHDLDYFDITLQPNFVKEYIAEDYKNDYVISCEEDKRAIVDTYGNVPTKVVPEKVKQAIYSYRSNTNSVIIREKSAYELCEEFIDKYMDELSSTMLDDLNKIMERI